MSELPIVRQAEMDLDLTRLAIACLRLMRERLDLHEWRAVKLVELEVALHRARPQVVGVMRELVARGYIERGERTHARGPYLYRLRYSRLRTTAPADEASATPDPKKARGRGYGMVSDGVDW